MRSRPEVTNQRETDVLNLLGLARRAGWAAVGTRAVEEAAKAGRLRVVVLAGNASPNAHKRIQGLLGRGNVPVLELGNRDRLGAAVGKGPVAVVGVMDSPIASRLLDGGVPELQRDRAGCVGAGGNTK